MFQKAVDNSIILKNPATTVELPELKQKDVIAFTLEDQKKFFEFAKYNSLYPLFLIAIDTVIRLGELLALTWDDIDFENELISVTKNIILIQNFDKNIKTNFVQKVQKTPKTKSSIRKFPMSGRVKKMLERMRLTRTSYTKLFHTSNDTYLRDKNVSRTFSNICKKAGISGYKNL